MVINYPPLGEVPPHPSLLVQGPDLLLLLLSCSPQEGPAWKKALFKPVFPEGDDALHQSQPSQLSPVVGDRKLWGEGHTGRMEVAGMEQSGKERAGISVPAKPASLSWGAARALLLSCHQQGVPEAGDITAEEMTSRGGQQSPVPGDGCRSIPAILMQMGEAGAGRGSPEKSDVSAELFLYRIFFQRLQ